MKLEARCYGPAGDFNHRMTWHLARAHGFSRQGATAFVELVSERYRTRAIGTDLADDIVAMLKEEPSA